MDGTTGSPRAWVKPIKHLSLGMWRRLVSCHRCMTRLLRRSWRSTSRALRQLWFGQAEEKPRIVLHRSFWRTLLRCWAHIVTLCVTAVLAWLNIHGYFVGDQFQGCTDNNCQVLDRLGLQVTAKLVELLVVVSLGTVLMDVVHWELLHSPGGLPLGLLALKQRFIEVQYLTSADFRFGISSVSQSWLKAWFYGILIIISTLISLLVGPSTALLLIPDRRSDWTAGGASMHLIGNEDDLWPSRLSGADVGGPHCATPTSQQLNSESLQYYDCAWAGFASLSEKFKEIQYGSLTTLSIHDSVLPRTLGEGFNGLGTSSGVSPETWVHAIHLATGALARAAGQIWFQALLSIPYANRYHTLRWRSQGGTRGTLQAWTPVVRTTCDQFGPGPLVNDVNSSVILKYPFLPEYDVAPELKLQVPTSTNSIPQLGTFWLPVPPQASLSDNTTTTDMPSAFLNIFLPQDFAMVTYFACSIDARWAQASYVGGPIDGFNEHYTQTVTGFHQRNYPVTFPGWQYSFLPINDSSWRKVQLDMDWVNALFPIVNGTPTNTSIPNSNSTSSSTVLASLLSDMDLSSYTDSDVTPTLEGLIATFVADGMSRTAFRSVGIPPESITDPLNLLPDESFTKWGKFMDGSYEFPKPDSGNTTELKMSVTVEGYAYRADSKAYKLALAVFFVHCAIVVGHLAYVLRTRVTCKAWNSMVEFVILAAAAAPNKEADSSHDAKSGGVDDVFANASSGVSRYRTFGTKVQIRARRRGSVEIDHESVGNESVDVNVTADARRTEEQVSMIFGGVGEDKLETQGYNRLKVGRSYS